MCCRGHIPVCCCNFEVTFLSSSGKQSCFESPQPVPFQIMAWCSFTMHNGPIQFPVLDYSLYICCIYSKFNADYRHKIIIISSTPVEYVRQRTSTYYVYDSKTLRTYYSDDSPRESDSPKTHLKTTKEIIKRSVHHIERPSY